MSRVVLCINGDTHSALWAHLLQDENKLEQAAFGFAVPATVAGEYDILDWITINDEGFLYQSEIYFELKDEIRGAVIKEAHDRGASLVEFHSHTGGFPARFSQSDQYGLEEFVPHIWWRLKEKPYFSVIVARDSIDGLAWIAGPRDTERIGGIRVGDEMINCTMLSDLRAGGGRK